MKNSRRRGRGGKRQSYYNKHLYNLEDKKSLKGRPNVTRRFTVANMHAPGDEIVDYGFIDEEYENTSAQVLDRSSRSFIQNAETQVTGKINGLNEILMFKDHEKRRNALFRQSSKEGKEYLLHLEKIQGTPENVRDKILHLESAEPISSAVESTQHASTDSRSSSRGDLLKKYLEDRKNAALRENYLSSTSSNAKDLRNVKLFSKEAFVRPVEPSSSKTLVQQVINGVPSGHTSSPRRALAEAKHITRNNPNHDAEWFAAQKLEYDQKRHESTMEEEKIVEIYRSEQLHKELLVSGLEDAILTSMDSELYVKTVQHILDDCAFREKLFLQGLNEGSPGDAGRAQFLKRMLEEEQKDTERLSQILDEVRGHAQTSATSPKVKGDQTLRSPREINAPSSSQVKSPRRPSKFAEFRQWHRERAKSSGGNKPEVAKNAKVRALEHEDGGGGANTHGDQDSLLLQQISDQMKTPSPTRKQQNTIMVRISKAIEKLARLMESQSGREIILSNAHALPALALILEKLIERDTFTSSRKERGDKNFGKFDLLYKSNDIIDRCLTIIAWQDAKIRNLDFQKPGSDEKEKSNAVELLQKQWDMLERMRGD